MNEAGNGRPAREAGRSESQALLIIFGATVVIGLGLIVLLRGTPEQWCQFTEFGHLAAIPAALALVAEIGVAIVLALGGLLWSVGRRWPKRPFVIAAGLVVAAGLSRLVPPPNCG